MVASVIANSKPATSHNIPKVVACVPCWNAEGFITRTLTSLVKQSYANLEILVSDDCSTDETLSICRSFASKHDKLTVIAQKTNLGWIGNTDALLARAQGDYLFFAFHDDIVEATFVEKTVKLLENNPDAILGFADTIVHHLDGSSQLRVYQELEGLTCPRKRALRLVARKGHWFVPTRGVFRSEVLHRIGGPRKHSHGEYEADWVWLLRMALIGQFVRVPETLIDKYYKPASRSLANDWAQDSENKFAVTKSLCDAIRSSELRQWEKAILTTRAWPRLLRHCVGRAVARAFKKYRLLTTDSEDP